MYRIFKETSMPKCTINVNGFNQGQGHKLKVSRHMNNFSCSPDITSNEQTRKK